MPKKISLSILIAFLLFIVNALSLSAEDNRCAPIFNSNCSACHALERGCNLLGQSEKEWIELFQFMEEMGADIPDDEKKLLIECLTKPDDTIKAKCQK